MGKRSNRRTAEAIRGSGNTTGASAVFRGLRKTTTSGESHPVTTVSQRPLKDPPSLELVLKRNPVERLKREKSPLGRCETVERDLLR